MIELILSKLSPHAQFSILFAGVTALIMVLVAWVFDISMVGIPAFAFVFGAVVYLAIDFYESMYGTEP